MSAPNRAMCVSTRERSDWQHEATEAAARDRLAEARENLKAAEREVGEAWSKRFSESNALDLQIERLECQLRDGAPVEVADFIRRALNLIGLRQLPTLNQ